MDVFDHLPDPLVSEILNKVDDVKTLVRCRSVSKRFNSFVPQSESLVLRLDPESDTEFDSPVIGFFRSLFKSLFPRHANPTRPPKNPAQILSGFDRIRNLEMVLPGGDIKLEKGAAVRWKAEFGKTLRSCVIVAFRSVTVSTEYTGDVDGGVTAAESDAEFVSGLKTRVVWTISALMAASARHFLVREVAKEHKGMEYVVLRDTEGEGTVVMDAEGIREYAAAARGGDDGAERLGDEERGRTVVPSVRMSMRHAPSLRLKSGICLEGATLVVVRPSGAYTAEVAGDAELATSAFAGDNGGESMYGEAVAALLKCRRNVLEMNSF
ncbi:PREDICTED: F-box protein At1g78100-like [Tarenaya hassleriana]|uniref:F-box protein At1g78100-like n=1 Tax=Tarenaya hassleriana TaxID=28532 RepID=UPI00053C5170|nr:PREDICTED: F-box protein At1g78100-like [Tarenaya hassleriana]